MQVSQSALATLSQSERELVDLVFQQGLSFAEAGKRLGLSEVGLGHRLVCAVRRLEAHQEPAIAPEPIIAPAPLPIRRRLSAAFVPRRSARSTLGRRRTRRSSASRHHTAARGDPSRPGDDPPPSTAAARGVAA